MTHQEAYICGWVWGRIEREIPNYDVTGNKYSLAAMRPFTSLGQIMRAASIKRMLRGKLDQDIREALWLLDPPKEDMRLEPVVPLAVQSSWQLGCHHGRVGKPLSPSVARDFEEIPCSK